jgi:endonuclease/exonuclease/phosphatase family metal-dependent hydrolase
VNVVRVATFNIRNALALDWNHAWFFRRRATLAAIAQLDADVVGLQEAYACQLRWLVTHLTGVTAAGDGRSRRRRSEHTPVLARADKVEVLHATTRWFGATPEVPGTRLHGALFPRVATTALVRLLSGAEVSVTCTHLDERSEERRLASVEQLVRWVDEYPRPHVVLGDFNATPDSAVLDVMRAAGFTRVDTGPSGTTHHFNGRTEGRIIDHILVRGAVTVAAAGVSHARPRGTLPSDHWPVWAELNVD